MASDRAGEVGWTPPRPNAPARHTPGASPGSVRGKLRSEYQARLGGVTVKKRRAGALKFPSHAAEPWGAPPAASVQATATGGAIAGGGSGGGSAGAAAAPPPRRGTHQTSMLDFYTDTSARSSAVASGVPANQPLPPPPRSPQPLPVVPMATLSPTTTTRRQPVSDATLMDMDTGDDDDSPTEQPPSSTNTSTNASARGAVDPSTPSRATRGPPMTPGRPPPRSPSDSFGLLGAGAMASLADRGVGSAGGGEIGGGSSGGGSGGVYSDRFIPARFGSIMESGSPFLAGSPPPQSSREGPRTASASSGAQGSSGGAGGGGGRGSGGGSNSNSNHNNNNNARSTAERREAADPGGIRGTEGAAGPVRAGAAAGAAVGGGGGGAGAAGGAPVGSPEYWPYGSSATDAQREGQTMLNMLLRSELLGADASKASPGQGEQQGGGMALSDAGRRGVGAVAAATAGAGGGSTSGAEGAGRAGASTPSPNVFRFKVPRQAYEEDVKMSYSISPVSLSTRLLSKPSKAKRKIPKIPFKVLDAPHLQDDFYLNLVDWSSLNVLAVGLGPCVYLWSACTSKVTKLCNLGRDAVASVAWTQRGTHLAVGTNSGLVQIWETANCKKIRTMTGHSNRVGTMSWNAQSLASGSRDRLILMRDVRAAEPFTEKLVGHKQEVCGLKWSFDDKQLASGGNDNKLFIWNAHSTSPVLRFNEHTAAVKAIAWSPHQHGILASGGGTADRCIRFWNSQTSARLSCVDTGSQVCNLMWSKNINEIVSTHGYSLNQIIVWRYPSMTKVTTLTGHTMRVLYLAMSPDGQTIVTGAGDETLRFWNAFPGPKSKEGSASAGLLFPAGIDIR